MPIEKLPSRDNAKQDKLLEQIQRLKKELEEVEVKIHEFEGLLRSQLSDLIVEAQELHALEKQLKKAKKEARLAQKKRGKNYVEPKGLQPLAPKKENTTSPEDQQEKKRLYREAMLHVHPDKFSLNEHDTEIATEITSRLIEIYKTGSLQTLQAYHAHIFNGNTEISLSAAAAEVQVLATADFLQLEMDRLLAALEKAKNNHLYKVTIEYTNPLTFADELKEYYEDRISKLKKRTRKGI